MSIKVIVIRGCDNCGEPTDPDYMLCNRCLYPTLEKLQQRFVTRGTYRGPFCIEDARKIVRDLDKTKAFYELRIVRQDGGFNVVEVIGCVLP